MPTGLKRFQQTNQLHFITFSCYKRQPFLHTEEAKDTLQQILEQTRKQQGHDFNVSSPEKFTEKLQYIHRNPVKRGLVTKPEDYCWSSFNHYATGEPGPVEIESQWTARRRETKT